MIYVTEKELEKYPKEIKQTRCPFCKEIGKLIFHGYLRGYDEFSSQRIKRGRRIFCNNRKKSTGCGRSFSLLLIAFVKGFMVSCATISKVITLFVAEKTPAQIAEEVLSHLSSKYIYFLISRLSLSQSFLREKLLTLSKPDDTGTSHPLHQTFEHLQAVFPKCAVSQFQHRFQCSFSLIVN